MSDITMEKRMALVRTIREETSKNQMQLQRRHNILYGTGNDTYVTGKSYEVTGLSQEGAGESGQSTGLGMRCVIAVILFSLFVIWDHSEKSLFSLNPEMICEQLGRNSTLMGIDFIAKIPYTLEDM